MCVCQTLCFGEQFAAGGDDDNHVEAIEGMQVLVLDVTNDGWFRERGCRIECYKVLSAIVNADAVIVPILYPFDEGIFLADFSCADYLYV